MTPSRLIAILAALVTVFSDVAVAQAQDVVTVASQVDAPPSPSGFAMAATMLAGLWLVRGMRHMWVDAHH